MKFSPEKIFKILKRNSRFVFICMAVGTIIGIIYALLVFKPVYNSTAKLLIKKPLQSISANNLPAGTNSRDFIATQMEILNSEQLARQAWKEIKEKYNLKSNDKDGIQLVKGAISLNSPKNTNTIKLTASWHKPEISHYIALSSVSAYKGLISKIQKEDFSGNRLAVERRLNQAQKELLEVRNKIKDFRKNNSTINPAREAKELSEQIITLENKQQELKLAAAAEVYKINTLAKNLDIKNYDLKHTGSAGKIINLSSRLENLYDQMAGLSSKYTEQHPDVKRLKSRINRLETQIQNQLKLSFGNNTQSNGLQFSNPVKTGMLEVLINSKNKYSELQAQSRNLDNVLKTLKQKRAEIPQTQFVLAGYEQQETSLAGIINNLKSRQTELQVRELFVPAAVTILDSPSVPPHIPIWERFQFIMLFKMFFGVLAVMFLLGREYLKNSYAGVEEMEKDLNTNVLGVIPWLDEEFCDEPDVAYAIEETASFYSLAYQKTVSDIRIKGDLSNNRVISFTSSEASKNRSTIIMNIAYNLSKSGESVIVVDADFRTPSIGKGLGLEASSQYSLERVLTEINNNGQIFDEERIDRHTCMIPNVKNLSILPNSGNVPDPCEFLYSEAFRKLIKALKKKYSWVLVDSPPAIAAPDAFMTGLYTDGTIIMTGLETNKSVLRKIYNQFRNYEINIFGIIARETQAEEIVFSHKYIRQMINRVVLRREEVTV